MPALELDDGSLLTENVAILPYLSSLATPPLMPDVGMPKWRALEALGYVSTEVHKAFKPLFDTTSSHDAKSAAKGLVAQRLGLLDAKLGDRAFIIGDAFSAVDAYLFVMLTWAEKQGIAVPAGLTRYHTKLKERPSVKKALAEEG